MRLSQGEKPAVNPWMVGQVRHHPNPEVVQVRGVDAVVPLVEPGLLGLRRWHLAAPDGGTR